MSEFDPGAVPRPVSIAPSSLHALRRALSADLGPAAAGYLQEAGYANGVGLLDVFRIWLHERDDATPERLSLPEFRELLSAFLEETGWGTMRVENAGGAVATVDSEDWAEADLEGELEQPGCHFGSGMLAGFLGSLAGEPLAVLEVECRSIGASRCRFLVGSTDVMDHVYESMQSGIHYVEAAAGTA